MPAPGFPPEGYELITISDSITVVEPPVDTNILMCDVASPWRFVLYNGSNPIGDVLRATSRSVQFQLDAPTSVTINFKGNDQVLPYLQDLSTDVVVFYQGVPMTRARLMPVTDDISTDLHTVSATFLDYRGLLGRQSFQGIPAGTDMVWPANTVTAEHIVWDLISSVLGSYNGLGPIEIRRGTNPALPMPLVTGERKAVVGQSVSSVIEEFARYDAPDGFDWSIDAYQVDGPDWTKPVFNYWPRTTPRGGTEFGGFVLEYPKNIQRVRRFIDPNDFANNLRVTGGDGTTPVTRTGPYDPVRGSWWATEEFSYPDITTQAALEAKADWLLSYRNQLLPSYEVTLIPGTEWDPRVSGVGAIVRLIVQSNRLDINTNIRVQSVTATINENEQATISFTVGSPYVKFDEHLFKMRKRIEKLELRQ